MWKPYSYNISVFILRSTVAFIFKLNGKVVVVEVEVEVELLVVVVVEVLVLVVVVDVVVSAIIL